jgi:hypothetical protein
MKKIIFGLNLILIFSIFGLGQKQKTDPQTETATNKPEKRRESKQTGKQSNQTDNLILNSATNIEAQLESALDVRKSKPGDSVVLQTTKAVKQNGEVIIPKGARLIGRVTEVQQKTKDNAASKLGVVFERLQGKNLDAPVSATIVSITQATASAEAGDLFGANAAGSSNSSGSGSASGGLLGGVTGTVGGVLNATTQTVGNVTNTAGQTLGGATQTVGKTLNGIQISQTTDATAAGATTLSAQNRNLRLEKGLTFRLLVSNSVEN